MKLADVKKENKLKWFSSVSPGRDNGLSIWGEKMRAKLGQALSAGLYDEQNNPSYSDWAAVVAWVYDVLFLANIP